MAGLLVSPIWLSPASVGGASPKEARGGPAVPPPHVEVLAMLQDAGKEGPRRRRAIGSPLGAHTLRFEPKRLDLLLRRFFLNLMFVLVSLLLLENCDV